MTFSGITREALELVAIPRGRRFGGRISLTSTTAITETFLDWRTRLWRLMT